MKGLRRRFAQFQQAGTQIVTISADPVGDLQKYVSGNAVPLIMLSDAERSVIKRYDVYNPSERGGVAIPAVFIIDKSGAVRFAHVERTIIRARNKTLLEEAKKL